MSDAVWILGVSMTKFGRFADKDVLDLAVAAALDALEDAGASMVGDRLPVDMVAVGSVGEAQGMLAQRLLRQIGQTGIPGYNVANACASGATALRVVYLALRSGEADVGLAVGAEKMGKAGFLRAGHADHEGGGFQPSGRRGAVMDTEGLLGTELMPGLYGELGMEFASQVEGVGFEQFARVAQKNHDHSTLNPLAQYRTAFSLEEIMQAPMIAYPNTLLMCCPTGDGAAAAVLVSDRTMRRLDPDQKRRAVKISASVLNSDPWLEGAGVVHPTNAVTRDAAAKTYAQAGVEPRDFDLVELHDCFATAELAHYENLQLCEPGGAGEFIDSGVPWRDGSLPVNVSGGLLSKGHPVGATGIANVYEIVTQLRDEAGDRQVEGARIGLAHVVGAGASCVMHVLERRSPTAA